MSTAGISAWQAPGGGGYGLFFPPFCTLVQRAGLPKEWRIAPESHFVSPPSALFAYRPGNTRPCRLHRVCTGARSGCQKLRGKEPEFIKGEKAVQASTSDWSRCENSGPSSRCVATA